MTEDFYKSVEAIEIGSLTIAIGVVTLLTEAATQVAYRTQASVDKLSARLARIAGIDND